MCAGKPSSVPSKAGVEVTDLVGSDEPCTNELKIACAANYGKGVNPVLVKCAPQVVSPGKKACTWGMVSSISCPALQCQVATAKTKLNKKHEYTVTEVAAGVLPCTNKIEVACPSNYGAVTTTAECEATEKGCAWKTIESPSCAAKHCSGKPKAAAEAEATDMYRGALHDGTGKACSNTYELKCAPGYGADSVTVKCVEGTSGCAWESAISLPTKCKPNQCDRSTLSLPLNTQVVTDTPSKSACKNTVAFGCKKGFGSASATATCYPSSTGECKWNPIPSVDCGIKQCTGKPSTAPNNDDKFIGEISGPAEKDTGKPCSNSYVVRCKPGHDYEDPALSHCGVDPISGECVWSPMSKTLKCPVTQCRLKDLPASTPTGKQYLSARSVPTSAKTCNNKAVIACDESGGYKPGSIEIECVLAGSVCKWNKAPSLTCELKDIRHCPTPTWSRATYDIQVTPGSKDCKDTFVATCRANRKTSVRVSCGSNCQWEQTAPPSCGPPPIRHCPPPSWGTDTFEIKLIEGKTDCTDTFEAKCRVNPATVAQVRCGSNCQWQSVTQPVCKAPTPDLCDKTPHWFDVKIHRYEHLRSKPGQCGNALRISCINAPSKSIDYTCGRAPAWRLTPCAWTQTEELRCPRPVCTTLPSWFDESIHHRLPAAGASGDCGNAMKVQCKNDPTGAKAVTVQCTPSLSGGCTWVRMPALQCPVAEAAKCAGFPRGLDDRLHAYSITKTSSGDCGMQITARCQKYPEITSTVQCRPSRRSGQCEWDGGVNLFCKSPGPVYKPKGEQGPFACTEQDLTAAGFFIYTCHIEPARCQSKDGIRCCGAANGWCPSGSSTGSQKSVICTTINGKCQWDIEKKFGHTCTKTRSISNNGLTKKPATCSLKPIK
jgi:hypothetical protein